MSAISPSGTRLLVQLFSRRMNWSGALRKRVHRVPTYDAPTLDPVASGDGALTLLLVAIVVVLLDFQANTDDDRLPDAAQFTSRPQVLLRHHSDAPTSLHRVGRH